jgi:endonuclease III
VEGGPLTGLPPGDSPTAPARRIRNPEDGPRVPLTAAARAAGWRRPRRVRVRAIRDRLRELYGRPANRVHRDPVHELVLTILSQNTNDRNRDVAYERLRERFASWEDVRDAPVSEVADAIRPGGLAETKAPRIQAVLEEIGEEIDLDWLSDAPRGEALAYLTALPGVGRKTAACVLIFSFDRPEIPVDTHVYRVGGRLGLFREGASFEEAHDEMRAVTDPEDAYELHINLITHGRRVCRPRPRCGECALRRMCPAYLRGRVRPI